MIFLGHFIAEEGLMFSEYKPLTKKASFYFFNENVFHVSCTEAEYKLFLEFLKPKETKCDTSAE